MRTPEQLAAHRAYMREYRKRPEVAARAKSYAKTRAPSKAQSHERQVMRKYGLVEGEYARMLDAQGGRCAVCGNKPGKYRLAVDHNHFTGEVRALLCLRCNRALGLVEFEPIRVHNLIQYLTNILESFELHPNATRDTMDKSSKKTRAYRRSSRIQTRR